MEPPKSKVKIEDLESERRMLEGELGKFIKKDPMEAVRIIKRLTTENFELKKQIKELTPKEV